ncbi:hypothetical protein ACFL3B_00500 [Gemmatimonadota bacterium]
MRLLSLALAVALLIPINSLSAQQPPPAEIGQRVRVAQCGPLAVYSGSRRTDCQTTEGSVVVMTNDSIVLSAGALTGLVAIPISTLIRLELPSGRKSHKLVGGIVGAIAGVGIGAWAGWASEGSCNSETCPERVEAAIKGSVVGLSGGALLGFLIGSAASGERWEEVPLDRLRVSFGPRRDGFALGFSIAF